MESSPILILTDLNLQLSHAVLGELLRLDEQVPEGKHNRKQVSVE